MARTPAIIGQVYQLPPELIATASKFDKNTLVLGMPPQWLHDQLYEVAGIPFETPEDRYAVLDRIVCDEWYDDKVCTFLDRNGNVTEKRSYSHSVTYREELVWEKRRTAGIDTFIASWDYVDNTHRAVIFQGILSYTRIRAHPTAWRGGYFLVNQARADCQAT